MFDVATWEQWRHDRFLEYPCPRGKWRFDLELMYPRDTLEEVPIERNPHTHGGGFTGHTCFYSGDDWSTIFGVHDFSEVVLPPTEQQWTPDLHGMQPCLRMLVESGNTEPLWGERIRLFSTSGCIQDEEWGRNVANKFAFFRGQYWRITMNHFLHNGYSELWDVMGGRIHPPIRQNPYHNGVPVAGPRGNVYNWWDESIQMIDWASPIWNWTPKIVVPREHVQWIEEGF